MKKLPFIIFCFIMLCAVCSGINSYRNAEKLIAKDASNALEQALKNMPSDVVTADTIQCYRSHLTIAELKDTAGISIRTVRRENRLETELVAEANCGFMTVFRLSDQKASGSLLFVGILWLLSTRSCLRRHSVQRRAVRHHLRQTDTPHPHAARFTRNVYDLGDTLFIKTRHLRQALAEEARCQRHALYPYPTDKTHHRSKQQSENRIGQRQKLHADNQAVSRLSDNCQGNVRQY